MVFCLACGLVAPDAAKFCPACGAEIQITKPESSNGENLIHEALGNVADSPRPRSKAPLIWGGAAILLIGLILVFASKGNSSYKIGYQAGKELSANNSFFYISGQPINICDMVLNQSLAGTPNDNIDWSGVKKDDFDRGCLDAYADTHDGMRIKTTETTPEDSAPASTGASTPASP